MSVLPPPPQASISLRAQKDAPKVSIGLVPKDPATSVSLVPKGSYKPDSSDPSHSNGHIYTAADGTRFLITATRRQQRVVFSEDRWRFATQNMVQYLQSQGKEGLYQGTVKQVRVESITGRIEEEGCITEASPEARTQNVAFQALNQVVHDTSEGNSRFFIPEQDRDVSYFYKERRDGRVYPPPPPAAASVPPRAALPPVVGLANSGTNTCAINSSLQALVFTNPRLRALIFEKAKTDQNFVRLQQLIENHERSSTSHQSPVGGSNALRADLTALSRLDPSKDAADFSKQAFIDPLFVYQTLFEGIKPDQERDLSPLLMQITEKRQILENGTDSVRENTRTENKSSPFVALRLSGHHPTFPDLMTSYFIDQGGYEWREDGEKKGEVISTTRLLDKTPEKLVVNFNKMQFNKQQQQMVYNNTPIDIPARYTLSADRVQGETQDTVYELESFIIHQPGHFISCVKKNGLWYEIDDSRTTRISESEALRAASQSYMCQFTQVQKTPAAAT